MLSIKMSVNNHFLHNFTFINVIAFCLVIPTYVIFFIGREPLIQGLAYSLYLIPLPLYIIKKRSQIISLKMMLIWIVFLGLWIIPSLINYYSETLESDLVRLPVLFFHVITLTSIILFIHNFLKYESEKTLEILFSKMYLVILPLIILIFLITLYQVLTDDIRPQPFGIHPNVASEISLVSLILALYLKNYFLRIGTFILVIATFYLCESRGALIASIIVIFAAYFLPLFISRITLRNSLILIIISMVTFVLIGEDLYHFITKLLLLDSRTVDIAGRLPIWKLAYQSILENPVTGVGFWVNPMGYNIEGIPGFAYGHPTSEIHNAFLRIATENGLGLLIIIFVFLIIAFYKLIKLRNFSQLAIFIGILFFLFFSTRHLTLNLLNIILYFVILKAMLTPIIKQTNHNQQKI